MITVTRREQSADVVDEVRSQIEDQAEAIGCRRVILFGHMGMGNLGDDMLFASALRYVSSRYPTVPVRALTMNPVDTLRRHGVEADGVRPVHREDTSTRRRLKWVRALSALRRLAWRIGHEFSFTVRSARLVRRHDVIIVAGSSQFIEAYGGAWGFPLTLLRWTVLARARGARIAFLSMGAEDVKGTGSRLLLRWTCTLASHVSVRDEVSLRRLRAIGVRRDIPLVPDLVLGLDQPVFQRQKSPNEGTVAINLVPYFSTTYWRAHDPERWESYVAAATALAEHVLDQGLNVVFYGTTEWADRVAADEVVSRLKVRRGEAVTARIRQPVVHTFDELWSVLRDADWVVASRYHGVVTALVARKPVLALCYERKTADVMKTVGVGDHAIDLDGMTAARLIETFDALRRETAPVGEAIDAGVLAAAAIVTAQYEAVLAPRSA